MGGYGGGAVRRQTPPPPIGGRGQRNDRNAVIPATGEVLFAPTGQYKAIVDGVTIGTKLHYAIVVPIVVRRMDDP